MDARQTDVRRAAPYGRRLGAMGSAFAPLVLMLLGACAGPPEAAFRPLPAQQTIIQLTHPAFEPGASVHSVSRGPGPGAVWYVSEVNGARALGVIAASDMPPGREAVQRPTEEWVRSIIPSRFRIAWGPAGEATASSGALSYRLFSMGEAVTGPVLACAGFSRRRGPVSASGLPRDVLYGYLCRYDSRPLERADAEAMLASISLRGES
jgi:hypothetical protein